MRTIGADAAKMSLAGRYCARRKCEGRLMTERNLYVSVSPLLVPVSKLFDYIVPENLRHGITPGALVVVPFHGRKLFALVARMSSRTNVPAESIKEVLEIVDDFKGIPFDLLSLCAWISKMYLCPLSTVLDTVFPFHRRMKKYGIDSTAFTSLKKKTILEKNVTLLDEALERAVANDFAEFSRAPSQRKVLRLLASEGGNLTARRIMDETGVTMEVIKALAQKGLVAVDYLARTNIRVDGIREIEKQHVLTPGQDKAFRQIQAAMDACRNEVFLLRGITGSGKTEVYMHAVSDCIAKGKRVIIIVPEIALATQIIARFGRRFLGRVAVWHSCLSTTERLYEWTRITSGAIDIIIGARSAIFAPAENIGLIIVDEEHESALKQESAPRYSGRDAAIQRAKLLSCPIVLGSATPSVESYDMVRRKKYTSLELTERVGDSELPIITVVDMRKLQTSRNTSIFSPIMVEAIRSNIQKGEQTMVFLNHRGYSQFVQCFRCGHSLRCPQCAITMKFHKAANMLKCHLCDHSEEFVQQCPACGSSALTLHGIGTERVYNQLARAFRDARIERMDRDTVSRKGEYQRIIEACEDGLVDILVGTQMIAKGLDFPGITLVCVISADSILNIPDFRSAERTYQILTQVAGRAGRRSEPGRVIIQTFMPEEMPIHAACTHNHTAFYEHELASREPLLYPPYTTMINFIIADENEKLAWDIARQLGDRIAANIASASQDHFYSLSGPAEATYARLNNKFRYFVLLRGTHLQSLLDISRESVYSFPDAAQRIITIDVNPFSIL